METIFTEAFSHPDAQATPWSEAERILREAELYWLTPVRTDGRPHVTPLVRLWLDGAAWFTTGHDEQKARNLAHSPYVVLTTGGNAWNAGTDVVVEGKAVRTTDRPTLEQLAEGYLTKYGEDWHFHVDGDALFEGDHPSGLFRVAPAKALAFAKDPHAQTTYRF